MRKFDIQPTREVSRVAVLFAAALLLLIPAAQAVADDVAGTVRGMVKAERHDGRTVPLRHLRVELIEPGEGAVARTYTDNDGIYLFSDVPFGDYVVEVIYRGEPKSMDVRIDAAPWTDLPVLVIAQ